MKILKSLAVIAFIAAIAVGATTAYFSDTETSTGNTFTAGSIDLKIDNHAWFNGVEQPLLSWLLTDLTDQLFFNYTDLKPGDLEEDTVSIHVDNNPSWVCANLTLTKNDDMTCTEPELSNDLSCLPAPPDTNLWDGELAQNLNFVFWVDDGDNVLEEQEVVLMEGPASSLPQYDGNTGITYPIVDSTHNAFGTIGQPFPGTETKYIGKAFCFGVLTKAPVQQGTGNSPAINPGVTCNGAAVNNASQSDSIMGNISFTAIQSRNNLQYVCGL